MNIWWKIRRAFHKKTEIDVDFEHRYSLVDNIKTTTELDFDQKLVVEKERVISVPAQIAMVTVAICLVFTIIVGSTIGKGVEVEIIILDKQKGYVKTVEQKRGFRPVLISITGREKTETMDLLDKDAEGETLKPLPTMEP